MNLQSNKAKFPDEAWTVEQVDSVVKTAGYGDAAVGSGQVNQMKTLGAGGQMVLEGQVATRPKSVPAGAPHQSERAIVTVGGQVAAVDGLNRFRGVAAVTAEVTNSIEIRATDESGATTVNHAQVTVPAAAGQSYFYDLNGNLTSRRAVEQKGGGPCIRAK